MLALIDQILRSPILTIVLTLLLIFQWYRQHAKEQSIKNNLFSIRRILSRAVESTDTQNVTQKVYDLIDTVDATLATLDARMPFTERLQETLKSIRIRFHRQSTEELKRLPNETEVPTNS